MVTLLELLTGANTKEKKKIISKIFDSLYSIPLNPGISDKAAQLMYTLFPLLTYNTKDFNYIEGLTFFTPTPKG